MPVIFFLLVFLGFALPVQAQELPPWTFKLVLGYPSAGFELRPKAPLARDPIVKFRPAQVNEFGLGAKYKWFGGTVYFEVLTEDKIRNVEGRSTYRDYHLNYYGESFGIEADYVRYTGFLIDNSSDLLSASTLAGERYYKLGDVSDGGTGVNAFYVFSPSTYNFAAGIDQTDIQTRSGGSTIALFTGRYHEYSSENGFLPQELRPSFGIDANFSRARLKTVSLGYGYGYNWVPSSFLVAVMGALSLGWQQVTYGWDSFESVRNAGGVNVHLRGTLGWNSRRTFTGFNFYMDRHQCETGTIEIGNMVYGGRLFFGVRLG